LENDTQEEPVECIIKLFLQADIPWQM